MKSNVLPPALIALGSALLFGASTPAAKLLIKHVEPQLLAGLFYLGSGLSLLPISFISRTLQGPGQEIKLSWSHIPWLTGAVLFGGIIGPLLLMIGLNSTTGGAASLLLNMEGVFTALLAWFVFKENFDKRIFLGMLSIVLGSILLTWQLNTVLLFSSGSLVIIGACFCWALDNNLTRNISNADPVQIAAIKGLIAGIANCAMAMVHGSHFPELNVLLAAVIVGLLGYGISLVLFIKALRYLGTSRTSAYFSIAPFVGATLSLLFLHEPVTVNLFFAAGFMAFGVWLHLTEVHEHEHSHKEEQHEHMHSHDEHHQHEHSEDVPPGEPHSHWHHHAAIVHVHPHYPDSQHRHDH